MKFIGTLLGDGRIMTLGLGGIAVFVFTALLGWGLGVGEEQYTTIARAQTPDSIERALVPGRTGRLPGVIRESSGVAHAGFSNRLLWTHNDGADARAFLVRHSGALAGIAHIVGADIDDAEDIDVGPCPQSMSAASCLYIADTGDNDRERDDYSILFAAEPGPESFENSIRVNLTMDALRFRYPGEARDAEALAVTTNGDILVITKGQEGSADVFRIPFEGDEDGPVEAVFLGSLPLDVDDKDARITAAAFDEATSRLAVRSDETLYLFDVEDLTTIVERCDLPDAGQGEGVDFLEGDLFVLTREGSPAPIEIVRCP